MFEKKFSESPASKLLGELAKTPVDLTIPGILSEERIRRYSSSQAGLTLSYATERVNDRVLSALADLAEERGLHDAMAAMQRGEIVNYIDHFPCESRAALHTATRGWVGEYTLEGEAAVLAEKARAEAQRLEAFLDKIQGRFTTIVQIGIGGSELGPKSLYYALQGYCPSDKNVYFLSNIDPDHVAGICEEIECERTLVVVVSKSGTTLETSVNEEILATYFAHHGLRVEDHFIAVTCEGSPMDNERYLEVFHIWDSIGGRYSSTSMVGGVVLSFAYGYEVFLEILKGAAAMDRVALERPMHDNLPMLSAMLGIWNRNFLHYPTAVIVPYTTSLAYFPAHLQQCAMESNGKSILQTGEEADIVTSPILWGEIGTNSQHSFFQYLHQGSDIVAVEFIGFLHTQREWDPIVGGCTSSQKLFANMLAQSLALAMGKRSTNRNKNFSGNRPSSLLVGEQLTPHSLGALLAFYEHKIVFQGFCWGINPFDQEGVALGKELANQILLLMQGISSQEEFPEAWAMLELFNIKK